MTWYQHKFTPIAKTHPMQDCYRTQSEPGSKEECSGDESCGRQMEGRNDNED